MRKLLTVLAVGTLVGLLGCNNAGTPGGAGASNRNKDGKNDNTHLSNAENSFTLSPPMTSTTVKQGEKTNVKIGISRGKNFGDDVMLSFSEPPKGVTITPAKAELAAGAKDATVSVEAAKDAAIGDFTITVTGKPKKGPDAINTFKLTVKKP
jgi:hypothetical protein